MPVPDSVFKTVYVVGFVVGSVIRKWYTRPSKRQDLADDRRTWTDTLLVALASVGVLVLPLLCVLTGWLDFADYPLPAWTGWAGTGVFAAALWLLWRSHVDLGRNWSPIPQVRKGHALVTRGVYRRIRHPMYAAHWLWALAQALLLHNWLAGPALLLTFLPLYLIRVPREERMMLDHFGKDYRRYMSRTGRVIPRLRR
jgi:protein-S-isoprenylcysteine O-methyltransferase Ste14